jgi:hypothetical protein
MMRLPRTRSSLHVTGVCVGLLGILQIVLLLAQQHQHQQKYPQHDGHAAAGPGVDFDGSAPPPPPSSSSSSQVLLSDDMINEKTKRTRQQSSSSSSSSLLDRRRRQRLDANSNTTSTTTNTVTTSKKNNNNDGNNSNSNSNSNVKPVYRRFNIYRSSPALPAHGYFNLTLPKDPLSSSSPSSLQSPSPLLLDRNVEYLGVLLDTGRHYFSLDWIRNMMDVISLMGYNMIHFRINDDQAFCIPELLALLESSQPEEVLVGMQQQQQPQRQTKRPYDDSHNNHTNYYTIQEIRDLVAYAKSKNITMIPELNVPGHGGAWGFFAGGDDLVVPCPKFICKRGYGIPLNVDHPKLRSILKHVLKEILEIFDDPPFLHLGGDELDLSVECFSEAGMEVFDYTNFERNVLAEILMELDYPESQVVRWESTPNVIKTVHKNKNDNNNKLLSQHNRTGDITHWWFKSGPKHSGDYTSPYFASGGLYMDADGGGTSFGAWKIFLHSRKYFYFNRGFVPKAIIVGAFELNAEYWYDRNIIGRLLAVALGTSSIPIENGTQLLQVYETMCNAMGFEDLLCRRHGIPMIQQDAYLAKWKATWNGWVSNVCHRLTGAAANATTTDDNTTKLLSSTKTTTTTTTTMPPQKPDDH